MNILLKMFIEQISKIVLSSRSNQFFQKIPVRIQKIEFRLVDKTEFALKVEGVGVIGVKITELDSAKILCFKPMYHGRHGAAGTSGEAKKLDQLQPTRGKADCSGIGGFEVRSTGGGDGQNGGDGNSRLNLGNGCFNNRSGAYSGSGFRSCGISGGGRGAGNCQKSSDQAHSPEKEAGFHQFSPCNT
jgi:hypothetical protein